MKKSLKNKSALSVNNGIEQPPSVDENAVKKFKTRKKKLLTVNEYVTGIKKGDITILSQAITLIESSLITHHNLAQEIIEKCLPYSGNSIRIGITGVPGVGKSTFIETFGKEITNKGKKLAVLAIDPSSERSKGSILGDKTRMEELSIDTNAYIRPSPSAGTLGGVARKTRETIILCESAGFDTIFIETVGVGQSETAVHSMVDFFLLLMLAGAGDELQGIKRGIMEMADMIAITKSDGENIGKTKLAAREYKNALHFFPPTPSGWEQKVVLCSAISKAGINDIWENIIKYHKLTLDNNYFNIRRKEQAKYWMYQSINEQLKSNFYNHPDISAKLSMYENDVMNKKISPFIAAKKLLNYYFNNK
ncbi:MAG: methylmalonyl Co-A mutase-associated GTPase MeaB [Bacteroidales bacterium]|nr:methylmalonyl Co-A mutase-associated GTPase MeaB [Bacteroidales bacterium]